MPRWTPSGRITTAFQRRYRLNIPLTEILTGILPTVQVDKHFPWDTLGLYGLFCQQGDTGDSGYQSCSILAPAEELLIHKLEFWAISSSSANPIGVGVHVFTPLPPYNPALLGLGAYYSWASSPSEPGRYSIGRGIGVAGANASLQSILVSGAPVNTIGPHYRQGRVVGTGGFEHFGPHVIWNFQDPPLRVRPYSMLTVQTTSSWTTPHSLLLNVNFWYSQKEDEGIVG